MVRRIVAGTLVEWGASKTAKTSAVACNFSPKSVKSLEKTDISSVKMLFCVFLFAIYKVALIA